MAARPCSISVVCANVSVGTHTAATKAARMRIFRVRATIPILTADEVNRIAAEALAEARRRLKEIEEADTASVLEMWDDAAIVLEDAFSPISLLNSVHPDAPGAAAPP